MIGRRTVLAAFVGAALVCPRGPAQESPAPPRAVIRTESRMVLVEAVARDKQGKLVRDLGPGDFRLWEDGREQAVVSFSLETAGAAPGKTEPHYLLLVFDNSVGSPRDLLAARRDAAKFVSAWAGPDRYMAVANFNGTLHIAQNFTLDPAPLMAAIGGISGAAAQAEAREPELEAPRIAQGRSGRGQPVLGATSSADILAGIADSESASPGTQAAAQPTAQPTAGSIRLRRGLLEAVAELAGSMASIRGRKSLALIGSGPGDSWDPLTLSTAIRACNRANAGVYVINESGLKQLAEETGGRMLTNGREFAAELGKVAEEQDEHYVLGYVPDESPRDCHALRVAVMRSGVQVNARRGYCNTRPVKTLPADTGKAVETRAASETGNATASMLLPYFYTAPNVGKVNVAMEIAAAAIPIPKVKGKPHGELNVVGIAYKPDGTIGGRFSDMVNLDFENDKEVEAFRKRALHYEYQFDLPPGEYKLRIAFSAGEQYFGKAEAPLTIDPWDGRSFAMSPLALAKESRKVADLASALDDFLLQDRRPLMARSFQIVPSGSNRFRSDQPCYWYAEIYAPQSNGAVPSLQVRILDRDTGSQRIASGLIGLADFVRPGSTLIPVAFDIPVHLLAPGSYRLEVKANDSASGVSALRTADFEVEK